MNLISAIVEGFFTWSFFAVLGVIAALILGRLYDSHAKTYRPLPILGHFTWFAAVPRQKSLEWLKSASDFHQGRTWKLKLPLIGQAWVMEDPACIKHVLATRHDAFGKGELATSRLADLFGDGIILTSGTPWKIQRTAGHAAFVNPTNLKTFLHRILPSHLGGMFGLLDQAEQKGVKVDLQEVVYAYAMGVFGELAYDSNFGKISSDFAGPFDRAAIQTHDRFFNPFYRLTEFFLPSGRKLREDIREVKRFGDELAREGRERLRREEEGLDGDDGVDEKDGVEGGKGMLLRELVKERGGDDQVRFLADSCLNFLTAGRDTTAQALSWTVYLLMLHPECKEKVIKELVRSEEPSSAAEATSLADLTSSTSATPYCAYTNAVISETLRLHPPVPLEIHENVSNEPILLPDGTMVNPGEKVVWSPWAMSRSERIWGPDAMDFKPERWLPPSYWNPDLAGRPLPKDHASRKTAYEFPVFHAGPRSCLGKQLARIELIFGLRELLRRYDFEPAWTATGKKGARSHNESHGDVAPRTVGDGLTGPIRNGLPVYAHRRDSTKDHSTAEHGQD